MLPTGDARLIDALQIAPRASWAALGDILGISAVTAAKRWQRLTDEGIAWITASVGMAVSNAQLLAYVEIVCQPAMRAKVASVLAGHAPAITVEVIAGDADLLVTVAAVDLLTISHYLLEHLGHVEGVVRSRVRIVTRLYGEGSSWRLRVLPDSAVATLTRLRIEEPPDAPALEADGNISEASKAILTHLSFDGRASYAELAERASISPATARRRVKELLRSGAVILRTDVSAMDTGWPVETYMWADVPVAILDDTARRLSAMRQARLTATVATAASLAFCSWLPTVEEVHRLELRIAAEIPDLRVVDRLIVLQVIKRNGWLLDESGRATGFVPMNIWDDLLVHEHRDPHGTASAALTRKL